MQHVAHTPATTVAGRQQQRPPQHKKLCKYLSQYGNCRYGDACHFFHPPAFQAKQPVALTQGLFSKPGIAKALTAKRSISTAGITGTRITIDTTSTPRVTEELASKRKRPAPQGNENETRALMTKAPMQQRQQPAPKKLKNNLHKEEAVAGDTLPTMSAAPPPSKRRSVHQRLGARRSPTSESPKSTPESSPGSSSPPSSPLRTFNLSQRSSTLFDSEVSEEVEEEEPQTSKTNDGMDYSCLLGSYAWDPSSACSATAGEQYGLTLLAGRTLTEGSWEIHQESLVSSSPPSPFIFGFAGLASSSSQQQQQLTKKRRIGLGGTFRFLPVTTEDAKRNVFWIELTKTKETAQEQGSLPTETITAPCVQRVPYQISHAANKVGVLINAFGKEQILLVKGGVNLATS